MSLFNVVHIAGTAMLAQTTRLNLISSNLTNQDSIDPQSGEPYRAKQPVFEMINGGTSGIRNPSLITGGVRVSDIVENGTSFRKEYQPGHPKADKEGYVAYSNVNSNCFGCRWR